MTLRNRVSVAAAVGVLIVVAGVSTVLYLFYAASLRSRVDAALVDAAQQATSIAQRIKVSGEGKGPSALDINKPVTVGSVVVQLFPGPVVPGQPTPFGPLDSRDVAVAGQTQPPYFTNGRDGGQGFRLYTTAWFGNSGGLVRTSRAANADDGELRDAAVLLAGLTVAAAAVTYCAARLTAGRILRPIAELTAAAEHVTQTRDLTARIGSAGANDEVSRLGSSFDSMLAALNESLTAQRQLVADASHELRTPLTSLTTNLDLLEDGDGLADPQAPALVRAARDQAGELDQLITDLLDLARYHESAPHRETVRLDLLTDEAVARLRQRAPHLAITTELHPSLVHVDPAAVDHAVSNLVGNAVKWTPPDAVVRVVVENGQVSVTDNGPGIADDDLPHIFERFYRAPAARAMPGAGLGLAIVAGVAHSNNGTVEVRTGPHGSTFTLAFAPLPDTVEVPTGQRELCAAGMGANVLRRPLTRCDTARFMRRLETQSAGLGRADQRSGERRAVDRGVEDLGDVRGPHRHPLGRQRGRDLQRAAGVGGDEEGRVGGDDRVGLPGPERGRRFRLQQVVDARRPAADPGVAQFDQVELGDRA